MAGSDVLLLDFWASVFGMRARIALAEKGIGYEYKEEYLFNKSPLLLEMNPVQKKIPVLIHHGKPVCEPNIIVQYIDEFWNNNPPSLLPYDPHLRAQSRFWADYADKKVYETGKILWVRKGEELEVAKKEFIDCLKVLEEQLGEKPYLVGESFGFADIAILPFYSWFYGLETLGNFSIEEECPKLVAWVGRCMERESVSKSLADPHKVYNYVLEFVKKIKNGQ